MQRVKDVAHWHSTGRLVQGSRSDGEQWGGWGRRMKIGVWNLMGSILSCVCSLDISRSDRLAYHSLWVFVFSLFWFFWFSETASLQSLTLDQFSYLPFLSCSLFTLKRISKVSFPSSPVTIHTPFKYGPYLCLPSAPTVYTRVKWALNVRNWSK